MYKYYIIYETKSFENKLYIGWHATNNLDDGYLGSGKILKNKISKHGKKNFTRTVLEFCQFDNVLEREKYWIKQKNTIFPNGYNLTKGGDGRLSPTSKKTKDLMSKQRKGVKQIDRFINAHGEVRGKLRYATYIKNQKKSRRGKPMTEETKRKLSIAHQGKAHLPFSEETKRKISVSNKGKIVSKESREKSSKTQKGKKKSEATKKRMSEARKGKKFNKVLKKFIE
jgi:group I intron endonuclease